MMDESHLLDVSVVTPQGIFFDGKAHTVILPGEKGVFEILINHRPLLSRLFTGQIVIDERIIPIRRGVVRVVKNQVLAVVEA
jgi:F-type H+-transporting ATPase subunit epsilon